jgi:DNA-binding response OmpR family regulator
VIALGGSVAGSRSQTRGWDSLKKPPGVEAACNIVLYAGANDEDRASLERIFKFGWIVIASATVASTLSLLREMPIPIVICDCDITPRTWGDLLDHISLLPDPPLLIVSSRLADERLWAEALNLGAWDVLAKPLVAEETIRIVNVALQRWHDRHGVSIGRTIQRKPATGAALLAATGT